MKNKSVCKELRGTGISTPIILISANSDDATREKALQAGASHFEGKPIKNMQFVALIKSVLDGES